MRGLLHHGVLYGALVMQCVQPQLGGPLRGELLRFWSLSQCSPWQWKLSVATRSWGPRWRIPLNSPLLGPQHVRLCGLLPTMASSAPWTGSAWAWQVGYCRRPGQQGPPRSCGSAPSLPGLYSWIFPVDCCKCFSLPYGFT